MVSGLSPHRHAASGWALRPAQRQAVAVLAAVLPGAVAAAYGLGVLSGARAPALAALTAAVLCLPAAALIVAKLRAPHFPHARLGAGNVVTIARGGALAAMAGLLAVAPDAGALGWALVALAGAILALDGVDGWAARRAGLSSAFGARLDVETDVAFAIIMAALAVALGKVGPWFLLLGLVRPAFLLAGALWPRLRAPLAPTRRRRLVAGVQMAGQVALLSPLLVAPVSQSAGAALLALVGWSFACDLRALTAVRG